VTELIALALFAAYVSGFVWLRRYVEREFPGR